MSEQRVGPGDCVVLLRSCVTVPNPGRPGRRVSAGTRGYVERDAVGGAVLRVVVTDAPDGRTDVLVVGASNVRKVVE